MIARFLSPTPDILLAYDDLRRRENEALLRLTDTLPRVDGLPPETLAQARDAVFHADHPFLLTLIGPFGSGKSSLINALLGEAVLPTGPVPTTEQITILRYGEHAGQSTAQDGTQTFFHPSPLLKAFSLVDTPGLESVFAQHSQRTDAFLHRSDWVVLVMLATQALSASNLQYLETLSDYGKRVLVVVNQVDLLDAAQRETVHDFVREQCLTHLTREPEIFLVSAKQALAARQAEIPDEAAGEASGEAAGEASGEAAWEASGMAALERFIVDSLDDRERLRQKLQTPLTIARSVLATAQAQVQTKQDALDRHRGVQDNIDAQIAAGRDQQRRQVDATLDGVSTVFVEVASRGEDAIRDLFQPARALGQITSGMMELIGLAGLARRLGGRSRAAAAFQDAQVMEPLRELPKLVNELGPRLEGRDLQDLDDLAVYTTDALDALPETLQDKVIGAVHPPAAYNREPLRRIRPELEAVVNDARQVEADRLDRAVRNALVLLGGWVLVIVIGLVLLGILAVDWAEVGVLVPVMIVLGALALILLGVALIAYRGSVLARAFSDRMMQHAGDYQAIIREAAAEQIDYGVRLRQDVAAPFTRLVNAQTTLQGEVAAALRDIETELTDIAGAIGGFWEREN